MNETGLEVIGENLGEALGLGKALGEEYTSRNWRARSVSPSRATMEKLPVDIIIEFDDTDSGALYEARSVEPVEPVRGKYDDWLIDPQPVLVGPEGEEVLSEKSDLDAASAAGKLRAQVLRTLALPREFHEENEVIRIVGGLPETGHHERRFGPAEIDAEDLMRNVGPFGCSSIDQIAAVNAHLGAGLLDSVKNGWHEVVDPHTIDQERDLWCVLAQLYETYHNGLLVLERILKDIPLDFGFDIDRTFVERFQVSRYYEYLTRSWQHEACQRRS